MDGRPLPGESHKPLGRFWAGGPSYPLQRAELWAGARAETHLTQRCTRECLPTAKAHWALTPVLPVHRMGQTELEVRGSSAPTHTLGARPSQHSWRGFCCLEPELGVRGHCPRSYHCGPEGKTWYQLFPPAILPPPPNAEHNGDFLKRPHRKMPPQQISPSAEGLNSAQVQPIASK